MKHHPSAFGLAYAYNLRQRHVVTMQTSAVRIGNLLVGLIVIVFAALLLADGVISNVSPTNSLFSLAEVKAIVGVVLVVLAASYFQRAKTQTS